MTLETLILQYGYPLLFAGTLGEGETVLVLAGYLAHQGYLSLPLVILTAFCGALAGDQIAFHIGRRHGGRLLARRPELKKRADAILARLQRHRIPLALGFRFLYGFRMITPFAIGLSGMPPRLFLACNLVGVTAWAAGVGLASFFFGHAMESVLGKAKTWEPAVMGGILVAGALLWILLRRWKTTSAP